MFVASLNDYDRMLEEDNRQNAMLESIAAEAAEVSAMLGDFEAAASHYRQAGEIEKAAEALSRKSAEERTSTDIAKFPKWNKYFGPGAV